MVLQVSPFPKQILAIPKPLKMFCHHNRSQQTMCMRCLMSNSSIERAQEEIVELLETGQIHR